MESGYFSSNLTSTYYEGGTPYAKTVNLVDAGPKPFFMVEAVFTTNIFMSPVRITAIGASYDLVSDDAFAVKSEMATKETEYLRMRVT